MARTQVNITEEVSGILPVANGGTGANTNTSHAVLVGNGTSAITGIAAGTSGNVLTDNGTTWVSQVGITAFGTSSSTACVGNDARLSDTRTPATGTSPYDLSIVAFGKSTTRATGTGDFPFGVKLQRAATFTSVTFRGNTNGGSGSLIVEIQKNASQVSGTPTTITGTAVVTGGTSTGSWAFASGDVLTIKITTADGAPGTGLIADIKGLA